MPPVKKLPVDNCPPPRGFKITSSSTHTTKILLQNTSQTFHQHHLYFPPFSPPIGGLLLFVSKQIHYSVFYVYVQSGVFLEYGVCDPSTLLPGMSRNLFSETEPLSRVRLHSLPVVGEKVGFMETQIETHRDSYLYSSTSV